MAENKDNSRRRFKNIILLFLFLPMHFAIAQTENSLEASKRAYEQLSQEIKNLEQNAQYSGDDPIIRKRLNLPDKLPSFEEWLKDNPSTNSSAVVPESQPRASVSAPEARVVVPVPSESVSPGKVFGDSRLNGSIKSAIYWGVMGIFLIFNYLLYYFFPRARVVLLSVPFDFGVKLSQSEEPTVRRKRLFIELIFLVLVGGLWTYFSFEIIPMLSENVWNLIATSVKIYFIGHAGFIISRFFAGYYYKCPSCKTPFAAACLNSWDEPKSTYEKKSNGSVGAQRVTFVTVMETGVKHKDWRCNSCNHEWKTAGAYTKVLSKHKEY